MTKSKIVKLNKKELSQIKKVTKATKKLVQLNKKHNRKKEANWQYNLGDMNNTSYEDAYDD